MSSFDTATVLGIPELSLYIDQVYQRIARVATTDNEHLNRSMTRLLQARGKLLRPSLLIAVAASCDKGVDDTVLAGCTVVQLVHLASLVHDDIIDEADNRWNMPTISAQEGPGQAILVGDYLFAKAFEEATTISAEAARVTASTIAALTDGQARELADKSNLGRTQRSYLRAINGKTAALFSASCQIGAMCANLDEARTAAFAKFGENFGMAFQLIDDVLDFISSPKLLGKPVGNDIVEGVYTMPLLLALTGPQAKKVKSLLHTQPSELPHVFFQVNAIKQTLIEAQKYNKVAEYALDISEQKTLKLKLLPDLYTKWALDNLVSQPYHSNMAEMEIPAKNL